MIVVHVAPLYRTQFHFPEKESIQCDVNLAALHPLPFFCPGVPPHRIFFPFPVNHVARHGAHRHPSHSLIWLNSFMLGRFVIRSPVWQTEKHSFRSYLCLQRSPSLSLYVFVAVTLLCVLFIYLFYSWWPAFPRQSQQSDNFHPRRSWGQRRADSSKSAEKRLNRYTAWNWIMHLCAWFFFVLFFSSFKDKNWTVTSTLLSSIF